MQNEILRYIHKRRFLFFWAVLRAFDFKVRKRYCYEHSQKFCHYFFFDNFVADTYCNFFNSFEISIEFCVLLDPHWTFLPKICICTYSISIFSKLRRQTRIELIKKWKNLPDALRVSRSSRHCGFQTRSGVEWYEKFHEPIVIEQQTNS